MTAIAQIRRDGSGRLNYALRMQTAWLFGFASPCGSGTQGTPRARRFRTRFVSPFVDVYGSADVHVTEGIEERIQCGWFLACHDLLAPRAIADKQSGHGRLAMHPVGDTAV